MPWSANAEINAVVSVAPPPVTWLTMDWLAVMVLTDSPKKLSVVPCASGRLLSSFCRRTMPSAAICWSRAFWASLMVSAV